MASTLNSLSELELHVLGVLWRLGRDADGAEISRAIKKMFCRSAAVGRVYVALGLLAERGLVRVVVRTVLVADRAKPRSYASLTLRGSRVIADWPDNTLEEARQSRP
jgi:DNA-binding PadR family transcriptional regulator